MNFYIIQNIICYILLYFINFSFSFWYVFLRIIFVFLLLSFYFLVYFHQFFFLAYNLYLFLTNTVIDTYLISSLSQPLLSACQNKLRNNLLIEFFESVELPPKKYYMHLKIVHKSNLSCLHLKHFCKVLQVKLCLLYL